MKSIYDQLSEERKELQEQGRVPNWYITGGYQLFKEKYLYQSRDVRDQYERIARTAASYLKCVNLEEFAYNKFFELLWNGWLSPSTPVLGNTGTDRGMSVSCSGNDIDDSVDGFYTARREVAILTKNSFGTSSYLGNIRPRGSKISKGGKSSGLVPVFKGFVQDMRDIVQGNRRGAWAGYLEIDHGDFDELSDYILAEPDDCNVGWIIKDSFIEKLNNNDPEAIRRYQKAMKLKMITGRGYFSFIDKINRKRPKMYKDLGLEVKSSNLCVSPETLILTKFGYYPISELENEQVEIWNGKEWSTVIPKLTGNNQKLLKIITDSGQELECTPYHKFYVVRGYPKNVGYKIDVVEAKDLQPNDKLIKFNLPIIEGEEILDNSYANGFYSGDGCFTKQGHRIYLYGEKRKLKPYFEDIFKDWYVQENFDREYGHVENLKDKFFVPTNSYTIESRISWLEGLCDSDGTIARNGECQSIQISNINKEFLKQVQLMLQTLGITSKVTLMREAGFNNLPSNDGTGELKQFWTNSAYRLLIGQNGINKLKSLGFNPKRLIINNHIPNREAEQYIKISKVLDEGRYDNTYCFTEPKEHKGMFNGILTGNCDEITLFSDKDHTFTCVLSSMNVYKYDEWKDTDAVFWATIFLDCIAEDFIQKAKNIPGLENAVRFTEKGRALGLGVCGLHSLFQKHRFSFGSLEAHFLNIEIFKHINEESLRASIYLAELLGEPEWCKGYGVRNTHRCVSGETDIITKQGKQKIKNLVGVECEIWNGKEWTLVTPFKTSENEKLYNVTLSTGDIISCTYDHEWLIKNNRHTKSETKQTLNLKVGDKLEKWQYPIINGIDDLEFAYAGGFFAGDGSYNKSKPLYENCKQRKEIRLYNEDKKCLNKLPLKDGCSIRTQKDGSLRFYLDDNVPEKWFVPSINYSVYSRLQWLSGLFDADGSKNGSITSSKKEFLDEVREMAISCGLFCVVRKCKRQGGYGSDYYYKLDFSVKQLLEYKELGFETQRIVFDVKQTNKQKYVKIVSIEVGDVSDTYCLTDPKNGTAVFNNVMTKQCAIAPTKSTALIMGGISEGINADPAMVYSQTTAGGEVYRIVPEFLALMKERGKYNKKTLKDINDKFGSVQHLDWLTDHEKKVFKTAFEINQEDILRLASTRAKYLDQWQSLNLFFSADEDEGYISKIHKKAFEDENILGLYYIYSQAGIAAAKECESCQ